MRLRTVLKWVFWGGIACAFAASDEDPFTRGGAVVICLFWLAIGGPFFALLTKPPLPHEEVETLEARLRANARPWRAKR